VGTSDNQQVGRYLLVFATPIIISKNSLTLAILQCKRAALHPVFYSMNSPLVKSVDR